MSGVGVPKRAVFKDRKHFSLSERFLRQRVCHNLVRLELVDERSLCLSVSDDGRGLPGDYRAGVGITALRERSRNWEEHAPSRPTRRMARVSLSNFLCNRRDLL